MRLLAKLHYRNTLRILHGKPIAALSIQNLYCKQIGKNSFAFSVISVEIAVRTERVVFVICYLLFVICYLLTVDLCRGAMLAPLNPAHRWRPPALFTHP